MQKTISLLLSLLFLLSFSAIAQNKYIGSKMCGMCHKGEKKGMMLEIWQKSSHAKAFETLKSAESEKIAKAKGLKKPAAESPECLECHAITADAKLTPEGVTCETCHGPGSVYKTMPIMKDKAKSIAAGMTEFKDDAAIERLCITCHNEKSPTHKEFKFEEMWGKIKHPTPKKIDTK